MNKLFAIAFMCIYLLLSVGVVKTTHYCMGREKSTELFSFQATKCPCSAYLPENSGCCKDVQVILTLDDSQSLSASLVPQSPDFFLIGNTFSSIVENETFDQSFTQLFAPDFSPPPREALYKTHCSLVFYDDELIA